MIVLRKTPVPIKARRYMEPAPTTSPPPLASSPLRCGLVGYQTPRSLPAALMGKCRFGRSALRPGATVEIVSPHFSHRNAYTDPTHRHRFAARSFDFFVDGDKPMRFKTISTGARFRLVKRELYFGPAWISPGRLLYRLFGLDTYETYLSGIFPAADIRVVLEAL